LYFPRAPVPWPSRGFPDNRERERERSKKGGRKKMIQYYVLENNITFIEYENELAFKKNYPSS